MILGKSLDLKTSNFSNICLLATPFITCPYFGKSIVYVFSHTPQKTLGFTMNKPLSKTSSEIIRNNTALRNLPNNIKIYSGGPVNENAIAVLHSTEYKIEGTLNVGGNLSLSENTQIIHDIATNRGPCNYIILKGCSTWTAGQLEHEVKNDSWICTNFEKDFIAQNNEELWSKTYFENNLPVISSAFISVPSNKHN